MLFRKKGLIYAVLVCSFVICLSMAYLAFGGLITDGPGKPISKDPAGKNGKPRISRDTVIKEELRYRCGDVTRTVLPTTEDFIGLDWEGLVNRFPVEDGWNIDDSISGELTLVKRDKQLCPRHRSYRHLGFNQGMLAVYEGPVGDDTRVLSQEDIRAEDLPAEVKEMLADVGNFNQLEQARQEEIRRELEFASEQKLNEWLENLDEYSDRP